MAKKKKKEVKKKVIIPKTFKFKIMRAFARRPRPRDFYGFFTDEQWRELKDLPMSKTNGITEIDSPIPKKEFFDKYLEFVEPYTHIVDEPEKDDWGDKVEDLKNDEEIKGEALKEESVMDEEIQTALLIDDGENIEPGILIEVLDKTDEDVINDLKEENKKDKEVRDNG